jgi:hypothetical protein
MANPFLENTVKTFQYVILWVLYATLQTFVLWQIVPLPFIELAADALTHAVLFGGLGILLWSVVRYGNYSGLPVYQRMVNYAGLAALIISVWLSVGYVIDLILIGEASTSRLVPVLPLRGFIGLLIYMLIIQHFTFLLCKSENTEKEISAVQDEPQEVKTDKPEEKEILERIAVKSGSKINVVLISEIICLQADGDYVQVISTNGKFLKEQTMKYFEEHLPSNQFVRVHRSCIVNIEMISRVELYEKQNQLLTLKNGQQIKTSPAGYKALRMALNL